MPPKTSKPKIISPKFEDVAKEFEKTHALIQFDGLYIIEREGYIEIVSSEKLTKMYKNIMSKRDGFAGYKFISQWTSCNNNIRKYNSISCYPPPLKVPQNVYNSWTPFFAELFTNNYIKNEDALHRFREHIYILCGRQLNLVDYVEKWIAQFIQFPAEKTVAIVMVSQEGAGKGYFCNVLKRIVGDRKYLELTDMKKVAGTFNSISKDAFLINLNEATASQAKYL